MTVLCWNTTWISVHSSNYNFFIFLSTFGYFLTEGLKNNKNNNTKIIIIIKMVLNLYIEQS